MERVSYHTMNNFPWITNHEHPLYIIDSNNTLQTIYISFKMPITNIKIVSMDRIIGPSWESRYEYTFIHITNLPLQLWKAFK
jgi:hypothetical protein